MLFTSGNNWSSISIFRHLIHPGDNLKGNGFTCLQLCTLFGWFLQTRMIARIGSGTFFFISSMHKRVILPNPSFPHVPFPHRTPLSFYFIGAVRPMQLLLNARLLLYMYFSCSLFFIPFKTLLFVFFSLSLCVVTPHLGALNSLRQFFTMVFILCFCLMCVCVCVFCASRHSPQDTI